MTTIEYALTVSRGSVIEPMDHGIVAVIDGSKRCYSKGDKKALTRTETLMITPLKHAAVPPPMAFCEVLADSNIVDCAISNSGDLIAILTDHNLEIHAWSYDTPHLHQNGRPTLSDVRAKTKPTTSLRKIFFLEVREEGKEEVLSPQNRERFTQVAFSRNGLVIVLNPQPDAGGGRYGGRYRIATIECQTNETGPDVVCTEAPFVWGLALGAQNLIWDVEQTNVWAVAGARPLLIIPELHHPNCSTLDTSAILPGSVAFRAPNNCERCDEAIQSEPNGTAKTSCVHFHQVSLTSKGVLVAGSTTIAKGCTSFIVTEAHLIFTTSQHLLKFVHLTEPASMEVPGDTPELDERCRSIERAAQLITVVPSSYMVVLQMPRGNLEVIYPRVLVLSGIRQHIMNKDYKAAFMACQTHQVDMNILNDYRPDLFINNVELFISQLKKVSRIDEFLSKLKEDDVSQTLYKDTLKADNRPGESNLIVVKGSAQPTSTPTPLQAKDKVNTICNAFLAALKPRSATHLQNIITAHVCKRPPDLVTALTLISSLRLTSTDEAEMAISHLCFLTDANRLYDTALSLYDLDLTLLVAQNSQRDPREHLPFLQSLHALAPLRRQYQIDNHLKNYSKALTSLHALSAHSEVTAYTQKHTLYTHAMNLYKHSPQHLRSISTLYAAHLASTSHHAAAATLYESLSDYTSAYPLHALAHHWRESMHCASLVPLPPDHLKSHALALATTLTEESHDYRSAATIHTDYLSDFPTAARLLCRGSYFADATRLLSLHNLATSIPEVIDNGLSDKFSEIIGLLADCKAQLTAQIPRILELRVKKLQDPLAFFGGDPTGPNGGADTDVPDNISLAPTDMSTTAGQSLFTRYGSSTKFGGTITSTATRRTSKTKRREERKRARGKKGSVYEEEYLVNSVRRLIGRVNDVQDEVGRLADALMRRSLEGRERAKVVDERVREVVEMCEDAVGKVWCGSEDDNDGERKETGARNMNGHGRPSGADGVVWESQVEMEGLGGGAGKTKAPEVKVWKKSPLLE